MYTQVCIWKHLWMYIFVYMKKYIFVNRHALCGCGYMYVTCDFAPFATWGGHAEEYRIETDSTSMRNINQIVHTKKTLWEQPIKNQQADEDPEHLSIVSAVKILWEHCILWSSCACCVSHAKRQSHKAISCLVWLFWVCFVWKHRNLSTLLSCCLSLTLERGTTTQPH